MEQPGKVKRSDWGCSWQRGWRSLLCPPTCIRSVRGIAAYSRNLSFKAEVKTTTTPHPPNLSYRYLLVPLPVWLAQNQCLSR